MKLLYITNGINGSGGLERVLLVKVFALVDDNYEQMTIVIQRHKEISTLL